MAFTFEAETGAGSPTANSYCSVSFADDYHVKKKRTATTWAALSTDSKQKRLAEATELIDRECTFDGYAASIRPDEQALYWPRYGCYDKDGQAVDSDTIPYELKAATAELAYRLEEKDLDKEPTRGVLSASAGQNAVAVTLDPYQTPKVMIRSVMNFLRPFLKLGGSSAFGKAVR